MADGNDNSVPRRPGMNTRWQKGCDSPNAQGRPKGSRNMSTVLKAELADKVVVRENGKTKKISKLDAAIKTNVAKTIQGDARHTSILMNNIAKMEKSGGGETLAITDERRREILARHEARQRARIMEEIRRNEKRGGNDEDQAQG